MYVTFTVSTGKGTGAHVLTPPCLSVTSAPLLSSVVYYFLLTAQQCNQNSKLISSGELLLRVMY